MTDDERRRRRPALAALLSFLFPGLGQLYRGDRMGAAALGVPVLLLVIAAAVILRLSEAPLGNDLLSPRFLQAMLIVDIALLAWRLLAIAHAGLAPTPALASADAGVALGGNRAPRIQATRRSPWRRTAGGPSLVTVATLLLLGAATLGMHAYVAVVVGRLEHALDQVFGETVPPPGAGEVLAGGSDEAPPPEQPEYHWDGTEPVNFLLLGVDAGPGREVALTDTILAVSIDPVDGSAVMISIPRDTVLMPLPDASLYPDARYSDKINGLLTHAASDVEAWCPDLPSSAARWCGLRTLRESVSLYLGIPIHYHAVVELRQFAELIDALGGVRLCLEGTLVDPEYSGPTWAPRVGIELPAGCRQYNGPETLAFARIRKGWMEMPDGTRQLQDDFLRAERQQEVLLALRREFAQADLLLDLPDILDAVAATVRSDFPRARAGDLASLLPLITGPDIERTVLGLPRYVDLPADPENNYVLTPRREAIRAEMNRLFGDRGPLQGWYVGSEAEAPTPAPGDGQG